MTKNGGEKFQRLHVFTFIVSVKLAHFFISLGRCGIVLGWPSVLHVACSWGPSIGGITLLSACFNDVDFMPGTHSRGVVLLWSLSTNIHTRHWFLKEPLVKLD